MSDSAALSITAADVLPSAGAVKRTGIAGAAITAGQVLYLDPTSETLLLANASGSSPVNGANGLFIALDAAAEGQPVTYVLLDPALNIGAALTAGDTLYLSGVTAGVITKAVADVQNTGFTCAFLGICVTGGDAAIATINFSPALGGLHS